MQNYHDIMFGAGAAELQRQRGSYEMYRSGRTGPLPAGLGSDEIDFLAERDSIYLASAGDDGWPYVQHRGGPAGFIRIVDATHIAWADRSGNKQYISAGNLAHDDRVSIIAMDYPRRARLKLAGHATYDPHPTPGQLLALGLDGRIEGLFTVEVVAFEWNCPKYITPRFTADEIRSVVEPLQTRIAELEAALAATSA
jgi:predicted pyridoxine 5'-phosphate oxidase superfamily flavin-nucleotide-binding protein